MTRQVNYYELLDSPSSIMEDLLDIRSAEPLVPGGRPAMMTSVLERTLGREFSRQETKGVRSAIITYDEEGDHDELRLFEDNGHYFGSVNLAALRGIEPAGPAEPDSDEDEPYVEESGVYDRYSDCFDRNGFTILGDTEGLDVTHFRKIPKTDWDVFVFALDNYTSAVDFCTGPHLLFYRHGYKQVFLKVRYAKGHLRWQKMNTFDETGLLLKQEFFMATPWGERYVASREDWVYNKEKRIVTCRKIDVEKGRVERLIQYDLDDEHRIRRAHRHLRSDAVLAEMSGPEADGVSPPPGMAYRGDTIYYYDSQGRLSAVEEPDPGKPQRCGRTLLEYNAEGLLISERCFNASGMLDSESFITYPNPKQVACTTRWYRIPVIDDD